MLKIYYTAKFKKDLKKAVKQGKDIDALEKVVDTLRERKELDPKYRNHNLTGTYRGLKECHIGPDWLLVYKIEEDKLLLILSRLGSHSELF